jgi:phosphatidylserine/phosphatidylglycerophosphate/cardiolipin synthase-like enzyme
MTWKNDNSGLLGASNEIKAYLPSHSWGMKLSQLAKQGDSLVRIATYSLNADYAHEVLQKRPRHVRLMCNDKFWRQAHQLARLTPGIEVRVVPDLHAKLVLIDPATVYVGSANFVPAMIQDPSIGVRGAQWHNYYAAWFDRLWCNGKPVS